MRGFTLVELLIVIALIAILSVAVLATINPIEQSNKAKDATAQNDAAEVMNAYERYYTVKFTYPWMDTNSGAVASADTAWVGSSNMVGAGLCSTNSIDPLLQTPTSLCSSYNQRGALVVKDELKDSFLIKGYTSLSSADPKFVDDGTNYLVINKLGTAEGNSVLVCYIPKAKANRAGTVDTVLYKPTMTGANVTSLTRVINTDAAVFDQTTGYPVSPWDFETVATSLFKCVP
ncbi:MAG: type II secretion system protein [Candidatus Shapirobacteria bacterium]